MSRITRTRWVIGTATALAATALLAGCATGATGTSASSGDGTPVTGGTLVYLEQQAHTNLYPPSGGFYPNGGILNQITDKLTWQDPQTLKVEPWIATKWTVNADNTKYTFTIRDGVTFSDGTPLDANAVAKNYDTYGLGNPALKQPVSEVFNNYDHSEVVDPHTVSFFFKKPSPGFLQGTSVIGAGLVSLSTLAKPFDALGSATNIVGSGPFVVAKEDLGKEVDLKARTDYRWGPEASKNQGRAYLDGIKFIVTGEDSVRIGSLLSGQADLIRQVQAYDEKQVEAQNFTVYAAPTRGVNDSIAFRPDNPLVSDVRVRRALLKATDSKEIVDTLFSNNYPQAKSVLAASAAGFIDLSAELKPDVKQAKQLLDEAGWKVGSDGIRQKDGKNLELTVYESLPQPQNKQVLQLVAQQWEKVGVKLDVLAGDAGSATADNADAQKTPLVVAEVGRADPDVIKSQFYPKNRDALLQKGGLSPTATFEDTTLNSLLEAETTQVNRDQRLKDTQEVQKHLIDQALTIPFFEEPQVFAGAPYVKGLGFEAVGRPSFYNTWLAKH
ncbi:TIGR04028 family ABC transporter substrate-binding protein [Leifsonia poae]|uniref:TIGR04028 family ABC transporter substrate-binding protein n=1 Tax=Leifsonia poae TaxID=110933 RepID=UPI001CBB4EA2|nr:TIGR04028 family ABC transporter substrate-binding protein [Leifsonia poae]